MKKWWNASMFAVFSCLMVVAAAAAPDEAVVDDAAVEAAVPELAPAQAPEAITARAETAAAVPRLGLEQTAGLEVEAAAYNSTRVVCTFLCNDGIGFLYNCPDSMGTCCAQAQPACEDHEGLESGICRRGRLGLPCTPL
ncbi:MAG: hypothetical protein GY719_26960 [bacterium]|nr:hypothetical protein [bacterium]